jgi:selenocysteine lyase/cysteine desulfurase
MSTTSNQIGLLQTKSPLFSWLPELTQRALLDVSGIRVLALSFGIVYLLGLFSKNFTSDHPWHFDKDVFNYIIAYWHSWRGVMLLHLLGFSFLVVRIPEDITHRIQVNIYLRTQIACTPVSLSRDNWTALVLVLVVGAGFVVPPCSAAFNSHWCFYMLPLVMTLPIAIVGLAIICHDRKPDAKLPLSRLQWRKIPYDVLVVEGCEPIELEGAREGYLSMDALHGQRGQKTRDYLKNQLKDFFPSFADFFRKDAKHEKSRQVKPDQIVITETAWDALVRVIDSHILPHKDVTPEMDQLPKVFLTSLEPVELLSRVSGSSFQSCAKVLSILESGMAHFTTWTEALHAPLNAELEKLVGKVKGTVIIVLSLVDCRSGAVMPVADVIQSLKNSFSNQNDRLKLLFVLNGFHGVGAVKLEKAILSKVDFVVGDFAHWVRGARELGFIIDCRRSMKSGQHPTSDSPRTIDLATMPFSHYSDFEAGYQERCHLAPLPRLKACDMFATQLVLHDMTGRIGDDPSVINCPTKSQTEICEHSSSLSKAFFSGYRAFLKEKFPVDQAAKKIGVESPLLDFCHEEPSNGIIVFEVKHDPSGKLISLARLRFARLGFQGKLLGKNATDDIYQADRLRFCFHYYHGTVHMQALLLAAKQCAIDVHDGNFAETDELD